MLVRGYEGKFGTLPVTVLNPKTRLRLETVRGK